MELQCSGHYCQLACSCFIVKHVSFFVFCFLVFHATSSSFSAVLGLGGRELETTESPVSWL